MKYQGVYKIENLINGKVYIGSSNDVESRLKRHFRELHKGVHPNNHLQRSFNKYGPECFLFEPIERLSDSDFDDQLAHEQHYIDKYLNKWDDCYNLTKFSTAISLKGEDNPMAKITDDIVVAIKTDLLNGLTGVQVSKKYGVNRSTVSNIKSGKCWGHVIVDNEHVLSTIIVNKSCVGEKSYRTSLSNETVIEIKKMLIDIKSIRKVSGMFGLKEHLVGHIARRTSWVDVGGEYNNELSKLFGRKSKVT